jgi:hypothetical protein
MAHTFEQPVSVVSGRVTKIDIGGDVAGIRVLGQPEGGRVCAFT